MSDIKKIVSDVVGTPPPAKVAKSNQTHSLNAKNYLLFKNHCRKHSKKPGEVIDQLIEVYLEQARAMGELDEEPKE